MIQEEIERDIINKRNIISNINKANEELNGIGDEIEILINDFHKKIKHIF